jgi:hypothetical protein
MGDIAKGNRIIWGFRHEATYATPLVVGVGHGVVLGSGGESISHAAGDIPDDNLEGEHQEFYSEKGSETVGGDLSNAPLMFDSIYHMLAHAIGECAAPAAIVQVVEGINDKLDMTEQTTGAFVATLTPGNYTTTEYLTMLLAAINADATDNTYTGDFGVTTSDRYTIEIDTGTDTFKIHATTGPNVSQTAAIMIGFTADTTQDVNAKTGDTDVVPLAYKHVLTPPALMNSAMGTFVYGQASLYLKEFVSTMFNGFTIDYPNQGKVNLALPAVPHGVNFDDPNVAAADKPVNLLSAIGTISRPGNRDTALWRQSVVRWNEVSAAALAAADGKKCSAMQVVANNNFVTDDFTLEFAAVGPNNDTSRISQPVRDNKVQFSGSFTFSRLQTNIQDLIDAMGRTRMKASIITTGLAIPGATNGGQRYQINVYMPDIQFDVESNVGGPGRVPKTVNYVAHAADSAPTGFPTGYTDGVTIEIINSRNINAITQV